MIGQDLGVPKVPQLSLAARHVAAAEAPPLALRAGRAEAKLGLQSPPPTSGGKDTAAAPGCEAKPHLPFPEVAPLALCSRRGAAQLHVQVPPLCLPKAVPPLALGIQSRSPDDALSDISTCSTQVEDGNLGMMSARSDRSTDSWGLEVFEVLGSGTMAIVHSVVRVSDNRVFAAKQVTLSRAGAAPGLGG